MKISYQVYIIGIILLLSFISSNTHAQTKKVKAYGRYRSIKTENTVLKSNSSIKNGPSTTTINGKVIEEGGYENNKKTGVWKYFSPSSNEVLEFNHSTNQVVIYNRDIQKQPDIIKQYFDSLSTQRAILIGSWEPIYLQTAYNFRLPPALQRAGVGGTILVKINISDDGKINGYKILRKLGYGIEEELIRVLKPILADYQWHIDQSESQSKEPPYYLLAFKITFK